MDFMGTYYWWIAVATFLANGIWLGREVARDNNAKTLSDDEKSDSILWGTLVAAILAAGWPVGLSLMLFTFTYRVGFKRQDSGYKARDKAKKLVKENAQLKAQLQAANDTIATKNQELVQMANNVVASYPLMSPPLNKPQAPQD